MPLNVKTGGILLNNQLYHSFPECHDTFGVGAPFLFCSWGVDRAQGAIEFSQGKYLLVQLLGLPPVERKG
jgi:hypothetical protein